LYRNLKRLSTALVIFLIFPLLSACGEEPTPTYAINRSPVARPTPTAPVMLLTTPETVESSLPPPTHEATVTPLATPSPLPEIDLNANSGIGGAGGVANRPALTQAPYVPRLPLPEMDDDEIDGTGASSGSILAQPTVDVATLPKVNGLPKMPLSNPGGPALPEPVYKENYGAGGKPKVGIQVGHWQSALLPAPLAHLRGQTGGSGGGIQEVDLVLDISRRVVVSLQAKGIEADLLPATISPNYTADAFVAIHADAASSPGPTGYKLARGRFSAIPTTDDRLMNAIYDSYGRATGFRRDGAITNNMTGYYAFNNRRRIYAVSKVTPAVILEVGFLTNASDRAYMLSNQDKIAEAIVEGVQNFLTSRPPLKQREKPIATVKGIQTLKEDVPVLDAPNGVPIAYLTKGQQFEVSVMNGGYYAAYITALSKRGYVSITDVKEITLPR
jgi:N-acetylmuramoyl-L-alanine amidase